MSNARWQAAGKVRFIVTRPSELLALAAFAFAAIALLTWWAGRDPWGLASNVFDALLIGTMTAVAIDGYLVRGRATRVRATVTEVERALDEALESALTTVDRLLSGIVERPLEDPLWRNPCDLTEYGVRERLSHPLHGLRERQLDASALVGVAFESDRRQLPVREAEEALVTAYASARDALEDLKARESAHRQPWADLLLQEEQAKSPEVVQSRLDAQAAVDTLAAQGRAFARALRRQVNSTKRVLTDQDPVGFHTPRTVPRWLRQAAYVLTAAWSLVLLWSAMGSDWPGPDDFWDDNRTNIVASVSVAFVASLLALLARIRRRVEILCRALPWYNNVVLPVHMHCLSFVRSPDLEAATAELAGLADSLDEAVVAIQAQNPSAELAFWTRVAIRRMRAVATAAPPITTPEAALEAFLASSHPPDEPDLLADMEQLRERHLIEAREWAATFGPAPKRDYFDLHRVLQQVDRAARDACCIARPGSDIP
nr:hypothetical protein [uncultured Nocardioides sp.]